MPEPDINAAFGPEEAARRGITVYPIAGYEPADFRRLAAAALAAAAPGEAVPGEAVPGEAVPGEAVPRGAVPGETGRAGTTRAQPAAGRIRPVIGQTFPLRHAADAHTALETRTALAKTLLLP
ncbi:MAG: zinc-binding dehydrogenase [Streptosporangiaceae bacterium]